MLQIIGMIVVVYAIARLLQAPLETDVGGRREPVIWIISILAILAIAGLAFLLMMSGSSMPQL
jgi:hypothetical protein